ncbi:hypothetical protein SmJEL517_g05961 [Synchytrium microbalum]|uniref:Aminopeptidase P N-terminal domain-containing protein n=1 Tax=Synchytrium microbalum TaxID=1806994 RepID=A0A507BSX5_9FUNG|nr:uncharacterized protein SmJEL517_g05961 [Synchytrium microbalum]TPX30478.1 hypothetical protein SmJEL517_g05961 [Synchytrium microbalum]
MASKEWLPPNFYKEYIAEAKLHREKVIENLAFKEGAAAARILDFGSVYLKGNPSRLRKWSDVEEIFRQESFFYYITGCEEPDCHVVLNIATRECHLFIPKREADFGLWNGTPPTPVQAKATYDVEYCHYDDELVNVLSSIDGPVNVMDGEDIKLLGVAADRAESKHLRTAMSEARLIKSAFEIDMMRTAAQISGHAHIAVMKLMKSLKPGVDTEVQAHALFEYECFKKGCHHQAYGSICASGCDAATLHYVRNDKVLSTDPGTFLLIDSGCEFHTYASDITRTYPIGGKFSATEEGTIVYNIVLAAQKAVLAVIKSGINWEDMHRLANRVICEGLQKTGVLKGSVDELIDHFIPALFFPHGQEVHDVGGYPKGTERIDEPGIRYLRMRRKLVAGMVLTVEPGLYFIDDLLEPALKNPETAKYFDVETLERFRRVGGVRIEDDVVITQDGYDSLSCWIPKEIADIEFVMAT